MDTTAFPGLATIGQLSVNVHDLAKATTFYRDTLGMKYLFEVPGQMSFFDAGGIRLMLARPEKPEFDHPGSIIYFCVKDIHSSYEALNARGARFESKPSLVAPMKDHDLWMAFFRDIDNNLMALMCEVSRR
jgi:catechol 2,3-dioxygenase-like lactoylglutathione lyase family enzyme